MYFRPLPAEPVKVTDVVDKCIENLGYGQDEVNSFIKIHQFIYDGKQKGATLQKMKVRCLLKIKK